MDENSPQAHHTLFNTDSDKLPTGRLVRLMRWQLPAVLCLFGVAVLVIDGFDTTGADAFAAFVGAGSSICLINFLWRLGVSGDEDRELEAEDRVYLREHGHWPDEQ